MFHAQIAQRAFNTPLLVEPSKAMAFLSGLRPRITGRQLRLAGIEVAPEDMAYVSRPGRLRGDLTNRWGWDLCQSFMACIGVRLPKTDCGNCVL